QNSGMPGLNTSQYFPKLASKVLRYQPSVCLIEGGINDILQGIPPERTFVNLKAIADTLNSLGIEPVLQSVLYTSDTIKNKQADSINVLLSNYSKLNSFKYIDLNKTPLVSNHILKNFYTVDGIHLTPPAYAIWAGEINKLFPK